MLRRSLPALACLVLAVACTHAPDRPASVETVPRIAPFSGNALTTGLPPGWETWTFSAYKKPTRYVLEERDGRVVMGAHAQASASGLVHPLRFDPARHPHLAWRWKVEQLIPGANNARSATEDAPVRIVVAFDGEMSKLRPLDRLAHHQFRMITRQRLPYATLMYIWENQAPVGTIIDNPHTSRIKMIVADSGRERLGEWSERRVNLVEDYRRAFGEDPPPVKWIGIMTDADNTASEVRAWYGDIRLLAAR